jgi:DNA-directed RNA polymerase subunit M/transcription elongation factor TFIIS
MPRQEESKKNRFSGFGLLGLDPALGVGDKVLDHIEKAQEEERERLQKSDYYAFCPSCHNKQLKKNLLEKGCFVCGWKGTEEDIELAKAKSQSVISTVGKGKSGQNTGYKINCPQCGASVVTEDFLQKGCWRCGYKE